MGQAVTMGAQCKCIFGAAPSVLVVTPEKRVMAENKPMANIMDFKPGANLSTFGTCSSIANPTVASATAAAQGVLTPMPCIPVPVGPWKPGSPTVMVANFPALTKNSILNCAWAGVITIMNPGTMKTNVQG